MKKNDSKRSEIIEKIKTECLEVLMLEQELNHIYIQKLNESVDIKIEKISLEAFIEACAEADVDVTPEKLTQLTELFND